MKLLANQPSAFICSKDALFTIKLDCKLGSTDDRHHSESSLSSEKRSRLWQYLARIDLFQSVQDFLRCPRSHHDFFS